ncbi:tRNA 2-thiocytidine(32) synthetase TtcA [Petrocella atlantisensis]|uniref:tRNA 2-thiocytidine(32) synthetase TtcA n=1 Tax=Petrocella atlantisensis TaxID=2173034 RepID=A0A3P7RUK9_9FIRM|nr:ATP-binding protein [Petrocella atlantisensis]VDN46486.1 tRNA 2-thiocytidine(32) synthetase TtcA [Petrocella atlantisensis]
MAESLQGSGCSLTIPTVPLKSVKDIERSIIKTYRKEIWSRFIKAVKAFKLVEEGDRIGIGVSGGKDSLLLCKLLQELKIHGDVKFEIEYLAMNPGYHITNEERLKENCQHLNIPITFFDSGIFGIVDAISSDYPCYLCAKMRRGALYAKAQELGCNKLALGHHFDDVIETQLMNIFYAGTTKTMMPRLKSLNFEGLELIRPMYYIHEEDIIRFTNNAGLMPMNCGCVVAAKKTSSKRREMKELIAKLKENNPDIDKCILQSAHNVNMDCIVGWQSNGQKHSFLDAYE